MRGKTIMAVLRKHCETLGTPHRLADVTRGNNFLFVVVCRGGSMVPGSAFLGCI